MLMTSVDRHSALSNPVTELASDSLSNSNQQSYLRLRLALSLNLRRQVLIAVCDDVILRQQFATELARDLANPILNLSTDSSSGFSSQTGRTHSNGAASVSRLVSLQLDPQQPDLNEHIQHWFALHPQASAAAAWVPQFQITGIDQLTRQPVYAQRSFLDALSTLAQQFPESDFNVLLWVTRPWCRTIQQSVPEFWRWHTAIFEFDGDLFDREPSAAGVFLPIHPSVAAPIHPNGGKNGSNGTPSPSVRSRLPVDQELKHLVLASVVKAAGLPDQQALADLDGNDPNAEPLQIWHQLEALQQNHEVALVANAYRQLGDWYRDRLHPGRPDSQELAIVIRAYEQALKLIEPKSEQVPDLLNDIGNLYWMKARLPGDESVLNLQKALKAYQFALERTHPEQQPQTYSMIQNNLGSVYSDLAQQQDPVENLDYAVQAYQSALTYRSLESDRSRYAATQNNLGTVYWNLAQHQQPMENFQHAIAAYNEALRCYTPEQEPLHYAMLQNNLGTTYWNLSQCEPVTRDPAVMEDYLRLAIGAYRVALTYRTLEAAPTSYAATQNNLGTAYWHLANLPTIESDVRPVYLLCTIDAYQEALSAAQYLAAASTPYAPPLSFDLSAAHYHTGLAYHQLALNQQASLDNTERLEYLKVSLLHQVQAAQGWQSQPEIQPNAINAMLPIVRTLHDRQGIQGQTWAMSNIPAVFLPTVMKGL